jgi:ABC-type transport system involved in multi-copper enzyme maturation permease subunit
MHPILTIAHLTLHEARRRKIMLAAVVIGVVFLAVYALGLFFIFRSMVAAEENLIEQRAITGLLVLAGIYVANFLGVASAVLLAVDTLSGEISSGVIETLAAKPVRRSDIVLGKWLGYAAIAAVYLVAMTIGVMVIARILTGASYPFDVARALPLMLLQAVVLLSITIAGGTRFSTVTNGIVAFGFYGLAFMGGFVEQIGLVIGNATARDLGTAVSLISPSDALWRMAMFHLTPEFIRNTNEAPPMFWSASTPTAAMIVWAVAYVGLALALAVRTFNRRAL